MIVPGIQLGLEGYVRIWLGAREEYLREGLRRVGEELKRLAATRTGAA
jgi:aspartate/methionine/tyrosine aminotransferase